MTCSRSTSSWRTSGLAVSSALVASGQILGDHGEKFDDLGFNAFQLTLEFLPILDHAQSVLGASPHS